ncbi:MAG: tetratricopeptide repeat protein [Pirellulales bacterium]|nr:tetratricopeptide repeat protein [Pirellulales bacterium]
MESHDASLLDTRPGITPDSSRRTFVSRLVRVLGLGVPVLLLVGLGLLVADWAITVPADAKATYVGREACRECHPNECDLWAGSDHDRAMDLATPETVLGDFNNASFTHFDVTSTMTREGDKFRVRTDDAQGKMQTFDVKYVFGVRPLQQYLVEYPDGRVQCLPLAWNTEKKEWYHLYPKEPIPHTDILHWTKPAQNWNYMCAECHSTNLQKNFELKSDTYRTTFSEIDVSCETCHGPGSLHVQLAESPGVFWDRKIGYGLPNLKSSDSKVEIETCAPCHCLRRVIYPDFKPGEPLLDYMVPTLLDTPHYYPDGQILEEDYVYGSFIQSKMYHNNVRCSNCHDPHTLLVKFSTKVNDPTNKLCCQCHLKTKYDTPQHHFHPDATQPGTKCVECHMPERTYMVADPRRDHSLRIPRPDLTVDLGVPNVCTGCHHDEAKGETPQWAADWVEKWYGKRKGPRHFAYAIAAGRAGDPKGEAMLIELLKRQDISAMVRASALLLVAQYRSPDTYAMLQQGLEHEDALVRTAAVRGMEVAYADPVIGRSFPPFELLSPLLCDPIRSVRVEVARIMAKEPSQRFNAADRKAFDAALAEYVKGQQYLSDRPESHLNMAVLHEDQGHLANAEASYRTALRQNPNQREALSNLARLFDELNRQDEAEVMLRRLIKLMPDAPEPHYNLGLVLGTDKNRLNEAASEFRIAIKLDPRNPQYYYNLGMALQLLKQPAKAEKCLVHALRMAPTLPKYLDTLEWFYNQNNDRQKALACLRLRQLPPGSPQAREILETILDKTESDKVNPRETKPQETKPDETKPDKTKPDKIKSSD